MRAFCQVCQVRQGTDRSRRFADARPYIYALAVAGQEGVETIIQSILADFDVTLGLCGYNTPAEILGKADKLLVKMN